MTSSSNNYHFSVFYGKTCLFITWSYMYVMSTKATARALCNGDIINITNIELFFLSVGYLSKLFPGHADSVLVIHGANSTFVMQLEYCQAFKNCWIMHPVVSKPLWLETDNTNDHKNSNFIQRFWQCRAVL